MHPCYHPPGIVAAAPAFCGLLQTRLAQVGDQLAGRALLAAINDARGDATSQLLFGAQAGRQAACVRTITPHTAFRPPTSPQRLHAVDRCVERIELELESTSLHCRQSALFRLSPIDTNAMCCDARLTWRSYQRPDTLEPTTEGVGASATLGRSLSRAVPLAKSAAAVWWSG